MAALPTDLRRTLERAIVTARDAAEAATTTALTRLAVQQLEPFGTMSADERRLRLTLRARVRQLGMGDPERGFRSLVEEVAYEQWHRLLFARFLAENDLLIHPEGVPVSLADCE
jgi:hypothetical protein